MIKDTPLYVARTSLFLAPLILALAVSASGKSIGKDRVNVREKPDMNSAVLFAAPLAYPIKVMQENGDWLLVRDWLENTGWVKEHLVSDINTAVVLVDKANIRSAANASSGVVSTAQRGEVYIILARDKNWVKLGYYENSETAGWIRDDLIFGE